MNEKSEVISGRIPIGIWAKICKQYDVKGESKSEQLRDLLLNKLLTNPIPQNNVPPQTLSQSPIPFDPEELKKYYSHPQKSEFHITQNPYDTMRAYPPCPHNALRFEENLKLIFCARDLEPPLTDRKIEAREVNPARCAVCIEVYRGARELEKELERQKAKEEIYKGEPKATRSMAHVNFPHERVEE